MLLEQIKPDEKIYRQHFLALADGEWHVNADFWGVAMSIAFDVAGVAHSRNLDNPLSFCPGLGGVEEIEDEYRREYINAMDDETLNGFQYYLNAVLDALEKRGLSY